MSYSVTLPCGCDVYVSCHPITRIAHTRILERRAAECTIRKHEVGERVWLWELLPGREPLPRNLPAGNGRVMRA